MDYEFDDIKIPSKPEEYALPLDTVLRFVYCDQPEGLAMSIYAAGKDRQYLGRGRIGLTDGFARIQELSLLDPFLRDRSFIPASYMKIFYRVHLPKLKSSGTEIVCDPKFTDIPAVRITVDRVEGNSAKVDVIWQANRAIFRTAEGFSGYVIAGDAIYRGDEDILRTLPYEFSGSYTTEGGEYEALRRIYDEAPSLFEIKDTSFLKKTAVQTPKFVPVQDMSPVVRPSVIPKEESHGTTMTFGGPALIAVNIIPRRRSVATRFLTFIGEMKRLAEVPAPTAQYVPFTCYWPTYAAMSREQKAWYFYWRSEYRAGKKLTTSISYIFVYVYELINRAYGTAAEGFESLMKLWEDYHEDYLSLDHYMPRWCMDYILVNKLPVSFDVILSKVKISPKHLTPLMDIFVNDRLSEGLHCLDFFMLCEYSEYDIRSSRFYKEHSDEYEEKLKACLAELDRLMKKTHGQSLLTYLAPPCEKFAWETYNGAVCGRAASRYVTVEAIRYSSSPRVRSFVGNVARYMENLLRKREKVNGRLRNIELSAPVKAAIERVVEGRTVTVIKPEAPAFVVDLDRARALESESWENTQKLIDAVEAAAEELEEAEPEITELPSLAEEMPEETAFPEEDEIEPGNEWTVFTEKLTDLQKTVLCAILTGNTAEAERAAAEQFTFADAVYEEINDLASDIIGDIIIDMAVGELYDEWQSAASKALGVEV